MEASSVASKESDSSDSWEEETRPKRKRKNPVDKRIYHTNSSDEESASSYCPTVQDTYLTDGSDTERDEIIADVANNDENDYQTRAVLDTKIRDGQQLWKVAWMPSESGERYDPTWEPLEMFISSNPEESLVNLFSALHEFYLINMSSQEQSGYAMVTCMSSKLLELENLLM